MMKKKKRVWALLLAAALLVTQLSGVAMAEDKTPKDGSIASFTALAKDVGHQIRPVGTAYEELDLPGTVTAEVYRVEREEGDTAADETGGETSILSENEAGGAIAAI